MSKSKFNVSILGEKRVGKTSLVQVLTGFGFNESDIQTVGIDNFIYDKEIDNKNFKFMIFDTAGQEKFRSLSATTIQLAEGFLLVFSVDNRESFNLINFWIESISENSKIEEKVLILVGNKIDIEKREITEDEARKYAESMKMKYFETSAKENKGINEVFDEIFNDIYELNKNKINEKKDNFQLKEEPLKKDKKKKFC